MTRYRNRTLKATGALWLFVVLADAGWLATSGMAALLGTIAVVTVAALLVLVARALPSARQPVPARHHGRTGRRVA